MYFFMIILDVEVDATPLSIDDGGEMAGDTSHDNDDARELSFFCLWTCSCLFFILLLRLLTDLAALLLGTLHVSQEHNIIVIKCTF